jgi:hypothetical protein
VYLYLLIEDPDVLRVTLATAASHNLPGDPVWLVLIGPSSSAKTEIINLLQDTPKVVHLSSLTPKTLASGLNEKGRGETSLLNSLTDAVLTLKDLTTVLEMNLDARKEIFAQLREVYDGRYDATWGTGKRFHWKGKVTLIAGVTPALDRYHSVLASLGPRFLFIRLRPADRLAIARKALENAVESDTRGKLAIETALYLKSLPLDDPTVSEPQLELIGNLADFVSRARSTVERDNRSREIERAPEAEGPGRLAKQFHKLARGLARVAGRTAVDAEDIRRLLRVGVDSLPPARWAVLRALTEPRTVTEMKLVAGNEHSESSLRRATEELEALGLIGRVKGGRWKLLEPEQHNRILYGGSL